MIDAIRNKSIEVSMIKALLFDLDGTLLPHHISYFIQKYLQLLAPKFSPIVPVEKFGSILMDSSRAMGENTDPNRTLREAFLDRFLPLVKQPVEIVMPIFDQFYLEDFPKLKRYTKKTPLARKIVELAAQKGFDLVIATNPVFPESAIQERMRWAGVDGFSYQLVTHFENMHFCKPRTEYYQEITDRINVKPNECLMIGNDTEIDLSASLIGIQTYLTTDYLDLYGPMRYTPTYQGTLSDFYQFLHHLPSPAKQ
jgi:FMN phosphatase YigB (HAD superfamily)